MVRKIIILIVSVITAFYGRSIAMPIDEAMLKYKSGDSSYEVLIKKALLRLKEVENATWTVNIPELYCFMDNSSRFIYFAVNGERTNIIISLNGSDGSLLMSKEFKYIPSVEYGILKKNAFLERLHLYGNIGIGSGIITGFSGTIDIIKYDVFSFGIGGGVFGGDINDSGLLKSNIGFCLDAVIRYKYLGFGYKYGFLSDNSKIANSFFSIGLCL